MKKLLLIAVVAAVTLVAGCSNSKKADVDDENVAVKTTGDSISMYLGTLYGAQMVQMADSTLNKTEFIDGMKTALNTASMDSLQKMGMALSQQAQAATGAEKDKLQSRLGGMGMAAQYMLPAIEGMKAQFKIELNKAVLLKYFKEAMTADKPVDTKAAEEALDKIMNRFSPMPGNNAVDTKAAEENAKAGAAYIEKEMKADKSLKKTASGLVYKVIKSGIGAKPTKDQTAMVKYEGRHIDGSVFDDGQGQVQEFPVSRVVPGFSEGLMLMSPGAKYRFYIPGNLGYGERGTGAGGPISPNETLVFDVELVGIK